MDSEQLHHHYLPNAKPEAIMDSEQVHHHYLPNAKPEAIMDSEQLHHHYLPNAKPEAIMDSEQLHHHYLPNAKGGRGAPSVTRQEGMPLPTSKPQRPKRYTPKDNRRLRYLAENTNFTWPQIAIFFPGRLPNTLRSYYRRTLKPKIEQAKPIQWTDEMVR